MKKLKYLLIGAVLLGACKKGVQVNAPTFSVKLTNARSTTADTLYFKLGDTCKFAFSGYADNVAYYSGQSGQNYAYQNRTKALGNITLSFASTRQYGTQTNTLKVLAVKNLAATDSASAVNATWTDITSRVALATSATSVASGTATLTDLVNSPDDNLTIAFKYNGTGGSTQPTWAITSFTVNNVLPDVTYTLGSVSTDASYWKIFKTGTSAVNWTATSTQLQVIGGAATNPNNESWIVSKPMYVSRVSPDAPTAILKSVNSSDLQSYTFKYTAAGTYVATFTSSNNSVDETKSAVANFIIKVIP